MSQQEELITSDIKDQQQPQEEEEEGEESEALIQQDTENSEEKDKETEQEEEQEEEEEEMHSANDGEQGEEEEYDEEQVEKDLTAIVTASSQAEASVVGVTPDEDANDIDEADLKDQDDLDVARKPAPTPAPPRKKKQNKRKATTPRSRKKAKTTATDPKKKRHLRSVVKSHRNTIRAQRQPLTIASASIPQAHLRTLTNEILDELATTTGDGDKRFQMTADAREHLHLAAEDFLINDLFLRANGERLTTGIQLMKPAHIWSAIAKDDALFASVFKRVVPLRSRLDALQKYNTLSERLRKLKGDSTVVPFQMAYRIIGCLASDNDDGSKHQ